MRGADDSMDRFLDSLARGLRELPGPSDRYAVAFSGGLDSTVLLAALNRLKPRLRVRALHIDHGLHPDSATWERHCCNVAMALGAGYESRRCVVEKVAGESLEAQARRVRYRALKALVVSGETLLTAHHADDQLETVMLRLLRGTGVRGLRGIARVQRFGSGLLARPLLGVTRQELLAAAQAWDLEWLEDPSNQDARFDRNYVRAKLVPRIMARWPAAARTAGRAARQMVDAQEILDEAAAADATDDPVRINCAALLELSAARRRNLLRYSIVNLGLPVPDSRQLDTLVEALRVRRLDAQTRVQWPGGEARIYRGHLYLFRPLPRGSGTRYTGEVSRSRPWSGPEGTLTLVRRSGCGLPEPWAEEGFGVRFRVGGERFKPLGRRHSRPLKKWLQEAGVPPWLRARIPLLYRGDELVAVGDLWVSAAVAPFSESPSNWQVRWTDHPPY